MQRPGLNSSGSFVMTLKQYLDILNCVHQDCHQIGLSGIGPTLLACCSIDQPGIKYMEQQYIYINIGRKCILVLTFFLCLWYQTCCIKIDDRLLNFHM